jgi:hypothetical protein
MVPLARYHARVLTMLAAGAIVGALAPPARAQGPERFVETAWLDEGGGLRVVAQVTLGAGGHATFPAEGPLAGDPAVVPAAGRAMTLTRDGRTSIDLACESCDAATPVRIEYRVGKWSGLSAPLPHRSRRATYGLTNATGSAIVAAEATLVLPAGYSVASVDVVEPAVTDSTTTLPYLIATRDGRIVVTLRERRLLPGDRMRVTLRIASNRTPSGVLIVLAVIGGGYLIAFRRLITTAAPKGAASSEAIQT